MEAMRLRTFMRLDSGCYLQCPYSGFHDVFNRVDSSEMLLLQVVAMVTMQALKFGTHPPDVFTVRSSVQQSFVGGMATGCYQPKPGF